jgi:tRNA modification GTPase
MRSDTIAAIATAPGEGAIGIVRLSGPDALEIAQKLFDRPLRERRAVFGRMVDGGSGCLLDEGIGTLMSGPRSYTGEDTVELSGHGGLRSLRRLFEAVLAAGARAAEPGEFTVRAFLNGRMDLTQAESVLDLVRARTDASADLALSGLRGGLAEPIRRARSQALEMLAYLGARADFPDEDVPLRDIGPELEALVRVLDDLVSGAEYGIVQREGARIAIAGLPNAGKSSLLNRLLGEERAIVTPIPGTTRDTIEETLNLLGIPAVLTDTAGIRDSVDLVEKMGVERSHDAINRSDIVLIVLDASQPLLEAEGRLVKAYADRRTVVALNKSDIGCRVMEPHIAGMVATRISALTGDGIDRLRVLLRDAVLSGAQPPKSGAALTTTRQRDAARRGAEHVRSAFEGFRSGAPEDLLAVDLGGAVRALGELSGEDATEDLLDTIFSRFCIGK